VSMAGPLNIFVVATILALAFAEPVASGPFEDGVAAYKNQNYVTAMNLWRPLAEAGDPEAQGAIGVLYRDAQGVPAGRVLEAYMWFSLAATGGNKRAATERDTLARTMTAAQIAEGKRRVNEWKLKPKQ
jgi:TPR repeat protein